MSGFSSPNYTQVPNDLFDVLMKDMGDAELRVVLAAVRKLIGFHRERDPISLSQFMSMTGLTRQGVINGIKTATEHGLLREAGTGKRGVKLYELVIQDDQSTALTSTSEDQSTALTSTSQPSGLTKETPKEKEEEKKPIAPDGAAGASTSPFGMVMKPGDPIFNRERVFDCIAWAAFQIKDMRDVNKPIVVKGKEKPNPAAARIGVISNWVKKFYPGDEEKVIAARVVEFYKAWPKRRTYSIPRDAAKFADEWIAWTQEKLPAPKLDEQPERRSRDLLPGVKVQGSDYGKRDA